MLKVKKKDKVVLLRGEDKGKRGEVLRVFQGTRRVLVAKLNMVTKHARPTRNEPGGVQKKESPVPVSAVMVVCPKCDRPARPRFDTLQTGQKVRICRGCSEVIL